MSFSAKFAKSIIELNQEKNVFSFVGKAAFVYQTASVDSSIWWKTFNKSFVDGVSNTAYIDIGYSGGIIPGTNIGATTGVELSLRGGNFYFGIGAGNGAGITATINRGTISAAGASYEASIRAGAGALGVSANGAVMNNGASYGAAGGIGIGVGAGGSVTQKNTFPFYRF